MSKKVTLGLLFVLLNLSVGRAQRPAIRIGAVIDGPWERNEEIMQMQKQEILVLTQDEFNVSFPEDKILTADWTLAGIDSALDRLLADPEVDMVLAMGVLSSGNICRRGDLPKPAIAPFVIDAELQGFPPARGTSGIKNLNYLSLPSHVERDIKAFREIVPFDEVTILINHLVLEMIPELQKRSEEVLRDIKVVPRYVPVGRSIDSALQALTPNVQAVYVGPLLLLPPGDFDKLVEALIARKIPSFSLLGRSEVERGLLATLSPEIFPRITRRVALNVQRILLGEQADTLPTAFAMGERLSINMATARKIGVSPPFAVMTEADVINQQREQVARTESLTGVMQKAIDQNLDLQAEEYFVAAGEQNIAEARSLLLPQIQLSTLGVIIDQDRANASFGTQAQRTWLGSASLSQIIYSESVLANVSIQKNLQNIRAQENEQLRLNVTQGAATAYLNVLRAKTFEKIRKENLKRTREHLELARLREAIGSSKRSEVFRWESEIANDRKDVIFANAQRNLAEIQLNQILHRPLEESFLTEEVDLNDPGLVISQQRLLDAFADPNSFKIFRGFMVEEGLASSPELRSIDAAISAKGREYRSATRSFWSPTIALQAEVTNLFREGGAGTASFQLPPEIPFTFPEADGVNWNLGLSFSIPLFEGGARFAQTSRASQELQQLQTDRKAVSERIEQRIRSALHVAGASHAAIALSRDAARASRENLDLVTDAYSQGAVDIIDLLDAQNSALTADLAAANAVYDFLIDLFEVERAIGGFYFFATEQQRAAWFKRLQNYFERAGVEAK